MSVYLLTLLGDAGQPALGPYLAVFGLGFVGMIVTFARSRRIPWHDPARCRVRSGSRSPPSP